MAFISNTTNQKQQQKLQTLQNSLSVIAQSEKQLNDLARKLKNEGISSDTSKALSNTLSSLQVLSEKIKSEQVIK